MACAWCHAGCAGGTCSDVIFHFRAMFWHPERKYGITHHRHAIIQCVLVGCCATVTEGNPTLKMAGNDVIIFVVWSRVACLWGCQTFSRTSFSMPMFVLPIASVFVAAQKLLQHDGKNGHNILNKCCGFEIDHWRFFSFVLWLFRVISKFAIPWPIANHEHRDICCSMGVVGVVLLEAKRLHFANNSAVLVNYCCDLHQCWALATW